MSLLASRGRVFAFEASKRNFDLLNENLQLNNITNVEALNLAIYDQNGEVAFEHVDEFAAGSYISETEVHDHRAQITSVQCVRLTDWCRSRSDLTRIDFIKMDIEGSEIKALQGSAEILNQYKPLVLVEFNAHTLKTFQGESMLSLYNVARGIFQHIYLVDNSTGDLYPVHSREEFNRLMTERNRQIEDFLCSFTNLHPPERKKWFWFWRS